MIIIWWLLLYDDYIKYIKMSIKMKSWRDLVTDAGHLSSKKGSTEGGAR